MTDRDCQPIDILRFAKIVGDQSWLYIIFGRPGPTGKTSLRNELRDSGFNAVEISENVFDIVDYRDERNHFITDYGAKRAIIVLNRYLKEETK